MRPEAIDPGTSARARFDKWLWAARFYRTRNLAAVAITAGHVRVDDQRIKPSRGATIGERVVLRKDGLVWDIVVIAISDRRGGACDAAALYRESPESIAVRVEEIARRKAVVAGTPTRLARPTKRERRKLKAFFEEI